MQDEDAVGSSPYVLVDANEPRHFAMARQLFEEYAGQLGIDLRYQDFASELLQLPNMYGPPCGCLLLILCGETPIGCGALRRLSDRVCEMKRLYVRRGERGARLGRRVAERLLERARALGYETMQLDTLSDMTAARTLYRSLGFDEIPAYYSSPLANTIYMEISLARIDPDGP